MVGYDKAGDGEEMVMEEKTKRRCESCAWWSLMEITRPLGRCHYNPPTLTGFPATYDDDWCRMHATTTGFLTEPQEETVQPLAGSIVLRHAEYMRALGNPWCPKCGAGPEEDCQWW